MATRSDRKDRELQQRIAERQEQQRQDLLRSIEGLKRKDFPGGDPNFGSVAEDILERQRQLGVLPKREASEGLNSAQKAALYREGMKHINRPTYGPDAWEENGVWYEPGLLGCKVPAVPVLKTSDDYRREFKEEDAYRRMAEKANAQYRVLFPLDSSDDVAKAMGILAQERGMTTADLLSIAEDEFTRVAGFQHIHALVEEIAAARAQGSNDDDPDEGRTDFGGGSAYAGSVHAPAEPQRPSKYTEFGRDIIERQKRMGVRKW